MSVNLELRKVDSDQHTVFYRYNVDNKYLVWFNQYQDNGKATKHQNCRGCIFSVVVQSLDEEAVPLQVYESVGSHQGYPNTFQVNWIPPTINLDNFEEVQQKLQHAYCYLRVIQDLFYSSAGEHYQLFLTREQLED